MAAGLGYRSCARQPGEGESEVEVVGVIQSLCMICRLYDFDPYTYLVDVLQRVGEHPAALAVDPLSLREPPPCLSLRLQLGAMALRVAPPPEGLHDRPRMGLAGALVLAGEPVSADLRLS